MTAADHLSLCMSSIRRSAKERLARRDLARSERDQLKALVVAIPEPLASRTVDPIAFHAAIGIAEECGGISSARAAILRGGIDLAQRGL